jgi:hypothetical protein
MAQRSNKPLDIDSYLKGRGSPMAGQGATFMRAGKKYGIDPKLLVGIATIESGAGAKMKNAYNPFNWGVHRGQTYGSYEESIMDVARGLRRNYLDQGLTTPQQIVSKYAPASDNNDEGNWASVVSQVMGQLGGGVSNAGAQRGGGVAAVAPLIPPPSRNPIFNPEMFKENFRQSILSGRSLRGRGLGDLIQSSFAAPPQAAPEASSPPSGAANPYNVQPGKGILAPASFSKTHDTSNLGWPAVDIMGKPGTPLRSPVAGTVVRHGTAQGGEAMYIDTDGDGEGDYWAGHITGMVPVGTKLKPGDRFAYISPDHAAPHLHWAKR